MRADEAHQTSAVDAANKHQPRPMVSLKIR